jgi:hypothetical protein
MHSANEPLLPWPAVGAVWGGVLGYFFPGAAIQILHVVLLDYQGGFRPDLVPGGQWLRDLAPWAGLILLGTTITGAGVGAFLGYVASRQHLRRLSSFTCGSIVGLVLYPIVFFVWLSSCSIGDATARDQLFATSDRVVLAGIVLAALAGGCCGMVIGSRRSESEKHSPGPDGEEPAAPQLSAFTPRSEQITDGSHQAIQDSGEPHV